MDVLDDERERALAEIFLAGLADGAGRRVRPEGFVICAAIVVARDSESAGRPEDEHSAGDPDWHPVWKPAEPSAFSGEAENFGRIEGREIGSEAVMIALKRGPSGVNDETSETEKGEQRLQPPEIPPRSLTEAAAF